jgi:hypothetical protein
MRFPLTAGEQCTAADLARLMGGQAEKPLDVLDHRVNRFGVIAVGLIAPAATHRRKGADQAPGTRRRH